MKKRRSRLRDSSPLEAWGGPARSAGEGVAGCYEAAVRLLASRAHSARELRLKLLRRGHPSDEIDAALERLREGGYLDDAAYARALIGRRSGGRGARAIASELAAQALAERLCRAGPLDTERIGARLLRRGFSVEVARAALRGLRL